MQALFLDRDGVINRERADYVKSWAEFEFLPGALWAIARLSQLELPIFVITNQSAVGRGIIQIETVHEIHANLRRKVQATGGRIDAFYICPHHPNVGCDCRKPRPGLLRQAAAEHQLDLSKCLFIGDSITDFQAARAVKCRPILLKSGRQGRQLETWFAGHPHIPLVADLATAVSALDLAPEDRFGKTLEFPETL